MGPGRKPHESWPSGCGAVRRSIEQIPSFDIEGDLCTDPIMKQMPLTGAIVTQLIAGAVHAAFLGASIQDGN